MLRLSSTRLVIRALNAAPTPLRGMAVPVQHQCGAASIGRQASTTRESIRQGIEQPVDTAKQVAGKVQDHAQEAMDRVDPNRDYRPPPPQSAKPAVSSHDQAMKQTIQDMNQFIEIAEDRFASDGTPAAKMTQLALENEEKTARANRDPNQTLKNKASQMGEQAKEKVAQWGEQAQTKAAQAQNKVQSKKAEFQTNPTQAMRDNVSQLSDTVKDKAASARDQVKESAQAASREIKAGVSAVTDKPKKALNNLLGSAQERLKD